MAPRSRYMTPKTAHFFESVSKELIYKVKGQSVYFHPFTEHSGGSSDKYEKIYGENTKKSYGEAIEVPCEVGINPKVYDTFEETYQELRTDIQCFILRETLKDIDFVPNIGDIVVFQRMYFEVFNVDDSPMHMGIPEYKYAFNIEGHRKRIDNLDLSFKKDFDI